MSTKDEYRKNSEAKFASPESNEGIGYYIDGEKVSPEEFSRRVARDAERIRAEKAEEAGSS